jgi:hypothetical protein
MSCFQKKAWTCLPQAGADGTYRQVGITDEADLPAAGRFQSSISSYLIIGHYIFRAT